MQEMFPIERSDYYKTYLAELHEIEKLKWIESEKAGRDIGIHEARWRWLTQYRSKWLAAHRGQQSGAC